MLALGAEETNNRLEDGMGTIDKLWVKLTCEACDISETSSASDKGSGWSGSHWNQLGPYSDFDATMEGGGKVDPEVTSAKCKRCGCEATIESAYGFSRPKGF
jgi:hypothetical protein